MNEIITIIIRDDRKAMNLLPVKPDNFPMCSCPPEMEIFNSWTQDQFQHKKLKKLKIKKKKKTGFQINKSLV